MNISLSEDIHSITELKRNSKALLAQLHETGRPIVLTHNGKADAVIIDIAVFEKYIAALTTNLERCANILENELLKTNYKHLIYKQHRIIFRIDEKKVYILRIIHGAKLLVLK